jgi:hypothetical protein
MHDDYFDHACSRAIALQQDCVHLNVCNLYADTIDAIQMNTNERTMCAQHSDHSAIAITSAPGWGRSLSFWELS